MPSSYTGIARRYSLKADGLSGEYHMSIRASDDVRNDEVLEERVCTAEDALECDLYLRPCSVYTVEITKTVWPFFENGLDEYQWNEFTFLVYYNGGKKGNKKEVEKVRQSSKRFDILVSKLEDVKEWFLIKWKRQ